MPISLIPRRPDPVIPDDPQELYTAAVAAMDADIAATATVNFAYESDRRKVLAKQRADRAALTPADPEACVKAITDQALREWIRRRWAFKLAGLKLTVSPHGSATLNRTDGSYRGVGVHWHRSHAARPELHLRPAVSPVGRRSVRVAGFHVGFGVNAKLRRRWPVFENGKLVGWESAENTDRALVRFTGRITAVERRETLRPLSSRKPWAIIHLAHANGTAVVYVFPGLYEKVAHLLAEEAAVTVTTIRPDTDGPEYYARAVTIPD